MAQFASLLLAFVLILWRLYEIEKRLKEIQGSVEPADPKYFLEFYTIKNGQVQKLEGTMFLKVTEALPLSIAVKDIKGNAAKIDGQPAWALTDPALGSLAVAADGLSAVLTPVGPLGAFKVQVSADADLGPDVKTILGELDVEILPGDAVSIEIAAGAAVPV